ncbi:hypothetical protein CRE_19501 [Caenorhabditis remanei]|uniref:Uncharacterized protein n=1 Tax=Caenorhabditis remanei TaxID=31234 RepID=E3NG74_CAERE|nr:hypothetical protein CRE_19501 [Caenorhabditis remanei]
MRYPPFLPNYLQFLNLLTIISTTIFCYLLDSYHPERIHSILNIFILISLCLSLLFLWFGKDVVWTFALIALCGIAVKIVVFFLRDYDLVIFYYCFAIFHFLLCLYIPIHSSSRKFQMNYRNNIISYSFIAVGNFSILVLELYMAWKYEERFALIFFQVYYQIFALSASRFFEWNGDILEDNESENRTPVLSECPISTTDEYSQTETFQH